MRDEIQKLLDADPFVPFQIALSSGQTYTIRNLGLVMLGKDLAFVAHPKSELHSVLRLVQIAAIDTID